MKDTYIINGEVYIGRKFEKKTIHIQEGKIKVLPEDEKVPEDAKIFDASEKNSAGFH